MRIQGFARGFLSLIAEGWDIEDTTGKGKHGPLPIVLHGARR
jgi:hypothetical protein